MIVRQCKFVDEEGENGGIYCQEGNNHAYIICGCCGGIFNPERVEGLEIFDFWVDLSEEILGD